MKTYNIEITKVFMMAVEAESYEAACARIELEESAEADELSARAEPQFRLLCVEGE